MSVENMQKPDAIFWDWDGTLVDSYNLLNEAHSHTREKLGFPPLRDGEYKQYFGKPRDLLYPMLYDNKVEEAIEVFSSYVTENAHKVDVIDGVPQMLEFFYKENVPMGIVSNKRADLIRKELEHLGWEKYFIDVTGAGEAEQDKPSGAPLRLALEKAGMDHSTQNIWFVGDTDNDMACAHEVGCPSILRIGHGDAQALIDQYAPIFVYHTVREFIEFLVAIFTGCSKRESNA